MKRKLIKRSAAAAIAIGIGLTCMQVSALALPDTSSSQNIAVTASSGKCGVNLTWEYDGYGTLTISGGGEMYDYASYEDTPWADFSYDILHIIVESGVTSIGNHAFEIFFIQTTDVSLPEGLIKLGDSAFSGRQFYSIEIPDTVTSIGSYCFSRNDYLKKITIPDSVTEIGRWAFKYCDSLCWITLSENLTSIGPAAFSGTALTNVTVPASVSYIGAEAFNCKSLEHITVLNPNCKFERGDSICNSALSGGGGIFEGIIYGYAGSTAETFAKENGYSFALVGTEPETTEPYFETPPLYTTTSTSYTPKTTTTEPAPEPVIIPYAPLADAMDTGGDGVSIRRNIYNVWGKNVTEIADDTFVDNSLTITFTVSGIGADDHLVNEYGEETEPYIAYITGSIGNASAWSANENGNPAVTIHGDGTYTATWDFGKENAVIDCLVLQTNINLYRYFNDREDSPVNITIDSIVSNAPKDWMPASTDIYPGTTPYNWTFTTRRTDSTTTTIPSTYTWYDETTTTYDATYPHWYDTTTTCETTTTTTTKPVLITGSCGENLTWTFDKSTGTLTISGKGEMSSYSRDYDMPWSLLRASINTVVIEDGVTSIGTFAFSDCSGLTSVTIPDSVTSIGWNAFRYTPWLSEKQAKNPFVIVNGILIDGSTCEGDVVIPDSVTSIGWGAFEDCTSLTTVTIPDSVTSIGGRAFKGCTSLTSVTIPDGVTSIEVCAFYDCNALTEVIIPDSVTSIGECAFKGCSALTSVTIPDSVTSIGYEAFRNCESLTEVTIPDSVTSIGNGAFEDCKFLTSVTIPDSVTSIGEGAFSRCESLTSVIIPDSVTSIEGSAFHNCTSLTSVIIPDSVTSIGNGAFEDCTSLTTVTIPDSATSIGGYAFDGCSALTSVTIPDGVTSIGDCAFYACNALTEVIIPDSVTSIGYGAFEDCTSLTTVTIPDSVTSIEGSAFHNCTSLTEVTILNPNCTFGNSTVFSNSTDRSFTGTIYGYENSTAQAYAENNGHTFQSLGEAALSVGDVNGSCKVDSSDAADLLIALAKIGAGEDAGLIDAQKAAADADGNGELNAADATVILQYAAYLGAGGEETLLEFLASQTA